MINGDLRQAATAGIAANLLGIRQEAIAFLAANDLDGNLRYDIILDGNNDADEVAILNAFDSGLIAFNDLDGFIVNEVAALTAGNKTFTNTLGITTTFTGAIGLGAGDVDSGDVLLTAGGFVDIAQPINAGNGNADVRMVVDGDVNQNATGSIAANELGITQVGAALVASNDINSNGTYDIHLCFNNNVDVFAASNQFDGGAIELNNLQRLVIGSISGQTIDGIGFGGEAGIVSNNGDQFIAANGSLSIEEAISAGTGDVRLIANGDIHQTANGTITSDELGVRQESNEFAAAEDLDGNGQFDVILDDGNDVNQMAGVNLFDGGVYTFNDTDDLAIDSVTARNSGTKSFLQTDGVTTTFSGAAVQGAGDGDQGDILVNADGSLLINQTLNAANENADVRLVADGDLHQVATGIILADELGARIETNVFSATNDIDGNSIFDIILCFDNRVSFFAADNQFDTGSVLFNSLNDFEIANVSAQTIGLVTFDATNGVTATNGSQFLQSTGALTVSSTLDVGTGSVFLIANGDVTQTVGTNIIAGVLGVRQEATLFVATEDTNGSGFYDIILTEDNDVGTFAAFNAFEDGLVTFTISTT